MLNHNSARKITTNLPALLLSGIIGIFLSTEVCAQSNSNSRSGRHESPNPVPNQRNYDSLVYARAYANGEFDVAITALYYMMEKDVKKKTACLDSLTKIYFITQAYQKCIITGNQVLSFQPDNLRTMEIVAISQKVIGNVKVSLDMYEKLYAKTHALKHAYYIAEMQYLIQRYGECQAMLEKIIADPQSEKEKLIVVASSNLQQTVMVKAAALNIKGMVFQQVNNKEKAKEAFKSALALEANFALPKANLESIDK